MHEQTHGQHHTNTRTKLNTYENVNPVTLWPWLFRKGPFAMAFWAWPLVTAMAQRPWPKGHGPKAMAQRLWTRGHGLNVMAKRPWPFPTPRAMALGHGPKAAAQRQWLLPKPQAMAFGHGPFPWPVAVALCHGRGHGMLS